MKNNDTNNSWVKGIQAILNEGTHLYSSNFETECLYEHRYPYVLLGNLPRWELLRRAQGFLFVLSMFGFALLFSYILKDSSPLNLIL